MNDSARKRGRGTGSGYREAVHPDTKELDRAPRLREGQSHTGSGPGTGGRQSALVSRICVDTSSRRAASGCVTALVTADSRCFGLPPNSSDCTLAQIASTSEYMRTPDHG